MVEVLPAEVHGQCIVGTKDFGNLLRMGSVMTPKSLNPWDESLAEGLRFAAMPALQCVRRSNSEQKVLPGFACEKAMIFGKQMTMLDR